MGGGRERRLEYIIRIRGGGVVVARGIRYPQHGKVGIRWEFIYRIRGFVSSVGDVLSYVVKWLRMG